MVLITLGSLADRPAPAKVCQLPYAVAESSPHIAGAVVSGALPISADVIPVRWLIFYQAAWTPIICRLARPTKVTVFRS
jgi:hypothetical protein